MHLSYQTQPDESNPDLLFLFMTLGRSPENISYPQATGHRPQANKAPGIRL